MVIYSILLPHTAESLFSHITQHIAFVFGTSSSTDRRTVIVNPAFPPPQKKQLIYSRNHTATEIVFVFGVGVNDGHDTSMIYIVFMRICVEYTESLCSIGIY